MSTMSQTPPKTRAKRVGRGAGVSPTWWLLGAERFGLLGLFAIVVLGFSLTQADTFATADNWRTIFQSQSVIAVVALALIVPLVAGNFDLSVGANTVMCSIVTAAAMSKHGWALTPAIIFAVATGTFVGLVNGVLVARLRLNGFIATLGTATIITGLVDAYTQGITIVENISQKLVSVGTNTTLGVPDITLFAAAVAIAAWYFLSQTPFGRRLTAIGSNPEAARLVGIRVDRLVLISYVMAGALSGIAGVLLVANQGSGDASVAGFSLVLPALAAVFLGASAFTPGQYNVLGTVVGLIFVAAVVSGLVLSGAQPWVESVFNGTALVLAVGASAAFRRRRLGA